MGIFFSAETALQQQKEINLQNQPNCRPGVKSKTIFFVL